MYNIAIPQCYFHGFSQLPVSLRLGSARLKVHWKAVQPAWSRWSRGQPLASHPIQNTGLDHLIFLMIIYIWYPIIILSNGGVLIYHLIWYLISWSGYHLSSIIYHLISPSIIYHLSSNIILSPSIWSDIWYHQFWIGSSDIFDHDFTIYLIFNPLMLVDAWSKNTSNWAVAAKSRNLIP